MKLKEQHVIKILLTVVIICLSNHLYCQKKIIGRYSSLMPSQEHYNYFDFNKNGTFEYHEGASLGDNEFGKGHYQIKNDSLILNYDLTELKVNGFHKYKTYMNSSDSIKLKVTIYDLEKKYISRINVLNMKHKYGVMVDNKGTAYLKFKRNEGVKKIEVSDLCCGNYSFLIDTKFNYEVDVFLRKIFIKPIGIKNEIKKFKIIEHKTNYIILDNGSNKVRLIKTILPTTKYKHNKG